MGIDDRPRRWLARNDDYENLPTYYFLMLQHLYSVLRRNPLAGGLRVEEVEKSKGGRPRHSEDVKRSPLNMRTDPALRRLIEASAEANELSLTQEAERLLRWALNDEATILRPDLMEKVKLAAKERGVTVRAEIEERVSQSFVMGAMAGAGRETVTLMELLDAVIKTIELRTGKRWFDDFETWMAVKAAALRLLEDNFPGVWEEYEQDALDELREQERAKTALKDAQARLEEFDLQHPEARPSLFNVDPEHDAIRKRRIDLMDSCIEQFRRLEAAGVAIDQLRRPFEDRLAEAVKLGGRTAAEEIFRIRTKRG